MRRMTGLSPRSFLHASIAAILAVGTAFAGACGGSGGGGEGGSTTTTGTGGEDTWPACHACLQTKCSAEIAACDTECIALQACLDAVCMTLAASGASDEGTCQTYCQSLHAGAKQKHLDLVNCSNTGPGVTDCSPPCAFATYDWDQCHADADKGSCKDALAACTDDDDCKAYTACAAACTSAAACEDCGTQHASGLALREAYYQCVETSCLAEYWLPAF